MFLSMLTADAAAHYGHEFSNPRSVTSSSQLYASSLPVLSSTSAGSVKRTTPLSPPSALRTLPPGNVGTTKSQKTIMFADPELDSESEAETIADTEITRPASVDSNASIELPTKRKIARSKITYNLALPPPRAHQKKICIRRRTLLQLQQLSTSSRPRPAYEIVCSVLWKPRLWKNFSNYFKNRDGLGVDDLVVFKSEEYDKHNESDGSDDESIDGSGVVAIISRGRKGENGRTHRAELCLDDGTLWEVACLPNGSYEFVSTDKHGLKTVARWVCRYQINRRRSNSVSARSPGTPAAEKKFNFSPITPGTRRHPVVGSMTRSNIEVYEQYAIPSPTTSSRAASPVMTPASVMSDRSDFISAEDLARSLPVVTPTALRDFILISGIWVAFREGWADPIRPGETLLTTMSAPVISTTQSSAPHPMVRSSTAPILSNITEALCEERDASPDSAAKRLSGSSFKRRILHRAESSNNAIPLSVTVPSWSPSVSAAGTPTTPTPAKAETNTKEAKAPSKKNPKWRASLLSGEPLHESASESASQHSHDNETDSHSHSTSDSHGRGSLEKPTNAPPVPEALAMPPSLAAVFATPQPIKPLTPSQSPTRNGLAKSDSLRRSKLSLRIGRGRKDSDALKMYSATLGPETVKTFWGGDKVQSLEVKSLHEVSVEESKSIKKKSLLGKVFSKKDKA